MKAGLLDRRLTIERLTASDPSGWSDDKTWNEVATLWAQRLHVSEDIQITSENENHFAIVTFRTRYFADVKHTDRLICEGETYEIRGIREIGRREGLEFKAKANPATADR